MAELQKSKKNKKSGTKRERRERRFVGEQTYASKVTVTAGVLGSLALGAGVYSQWVSATPGAAAPYLLAGGALALVGALAFGDIATPPMRVGDAGIAIERGNELVRIVWCDLERVHADQDTLVLKTEEDVYRISITAHPKAVAWILAEGFRRVPDAMDVKRATLTGLPEPSEHDGEVLKVESIQVAGKSCAESGKTISFERDARLCPRCCEVYLHDHVPKRCVTCDAELGDRAVRA
jgi:hypothetical protein